MGRLAILNVLVILVALPCFWQSILGHHHAVDPDIITLHGITIRVGCLVPNSSFYKEHGQPLCYDIAPFEHIFKPYNISLVMSSTMESGLALRTKLETFSIDMAVTPIPVIDATNSLNFFAGTFTTSRLTYAEPNRKRVKPRFTQGLLSSLTLNYIIAVSILSLIFRKNYGFWNLLYSHIGVFLTQCQPIFLQRHLPFVFPLLAVIILTSILRSELTAILRQNPFADPITIESAISLIAKGKLHACLGVESHAYDHERKIAHDFGGFSLVKKLRIEYRPASQCLSETILARNTISLGFEQELRFFAKALRYNSSVPRRPCGTIFEVSKTFLGSTFLSLPYNIKFAHTRGIGKIIVRASESGFFEHEALLSQRRKDLRRKMYYKDIRSYHQSENQQSLHGSDEKTPKKKSNKYSYKLRELEDVFYWLFMGIGISSLAFICEVVHHITTHICRLI